MMAGRIASALTVTSTSHQRPPVAATRVVVQDMQTRRRRHHRLPLHRSCLRSVSATAF